MENSKFIQFLKCHLKQTANMFAMMFPQKKNELWLLIGIFLFYFSYVVVLATKTIIIDGVVCGDLFFNFDNHAYFHWGKHYRASHPFAKEILFPFMAVGNLLNNLGFVKGKGVLFTILCTSLVSFSVLSVYKYLQNIVEIKGFKLWVTICFFTFFSTNLTLVFTTESYTISLFLITFTLYFYSYKIKNNQKIGLLPSVILLLSLGGITITNFAKGIIPSLFIEGSRKFRILRMSVLLAIWTFAIAILQYLFNIVALAKDYGAQYSDPRMFDKKGSVFHQIVDLCFGSPILFPTVYLNKARAENLCMDGRIDMETYQHVWQYLIVFGLLSLIIYAIVRNVKNNLVQMLILFLGCDFMLHIIIGFGRGEGFIYGAHWVTIIPLMVGWLFKSIKNRESKIILAIFTCITVCIIINNISQLANFIDISLKYFSV